MAFMIDSVYICNQGIYSILSMVFKHLSVVKLIRECWKSRVNDVSEMAIDRHALRVNLLIGRCNKEAL
jgi:hypothetical protein